MPAASTAIERVNARRRLNIIDLLSIIRRSRRGRSVLTLPAQDRILRSHMSSHVDFRGGLPARARRAGAAFFIPVAIAAALVPCLPGRLPAAPESPAAVLYQRAYTSNNLLGL